MRYCIVRHVGFLLGGSHGRSSGDATAAPQTVADVVRLLRRPTPWQRDMTLVYAQLENLAEPIETWPDSDEDLEDSIFACAAVMFVEPAHSGRARHALLRAIGSRRFEFLSGCLAFIRTAHYWTMLHPEIESEGDMLSLLRGQEELARLLFGDSEADRCEMGARPPRTAGTRKGQTGIGREGSTEGPVHRCTGTRAAQSARYDPCISRCPGAYQHC
jgi:hypothetical protein